MSQEKVNRYKEQKANRKEIMQKEKKQAAMRKTITVVVAAACIGWLGYSAYGVVTRPDDTPYEVNLNAYDQYQEQLTAEE